MRISAFAAEYPVPNYPYDITTADIDCDGDVDENCIEEEIEEETEMEGEKPAYDPQLQRAVDLLKGEMIFRTFQREEGENK